MRADQENTIHTQIQYKLVEKLTLMNQELKLEIEERKKTEKNLRTVNKELENAIQVKSDFLSTMSHEIRTPSNIIIGYSQLLTLHPTSDSQKELGAIKFAADELLNIVNQILQYSKLESKKMPIVSEKFSCLQLLNHFHDVFEQKAQNKSIKFEIDNDTTIPKFLIGDSGKLNQILFNLVGNAFKFTHQGKIELQSRLIQKKKDTVMIQFTIKDTGIGIKKEDMEIIFQRFQQIQSDIKREYGGIGLGLAITKELVHHLGGTISIESKPGSGSSFIVSLPFKYKNTFDLTDQNKNFFGETPLKGLKVLLVEDYLFNQVLTSKVLEKLGSQVEIAQDGVKAIELIDNSKTNFDLILMDLHMPNMNGYETTKKIRKTGNNIPIIGFSADVMDDTKQKVLQSGMNDIIPKPFVIDQLAEKIYTNLKTTM